MYFERAIKKTLEPLYNKMVELKHFGPFDGGCYEFARILQKRFPHSEIVAALAGNTAHHYAVRVGEDSYVDFGGVYNKEEFLEEVDKMLPPYHSEILRIGKKDPDPELVFSPDIQKELEEALSDEAVDQIKKAVAEHANYGERELSREEKIESMNRYGETIKQFFLLGEEMENRLRDVEKTQNVSILSDDILRKMEDAYKALESDPVFGINGTNNSLSEGDLILLEEIMNTVSIQIGLRDALSSLALTARQDLHRRMLSLKHQSTFGGFYGVNQNIRDMIEDVIERTFEAHGPEKWVGKINDMHYSKGDVLAVMMNGKLPFYGIGVEAIHKVFKKKSPSEYEKIISILTSPEQILRNIVTLAEKSIDIKEEEEIEQRIKNAISGDVLNQKSELKKIFLDDNMQINQDPKLAYILSYIDRIPLEYRSSGIEIKSSMERENNQNIASKKGLSR